MEMSSIFMLALAGRTEWGSIVWVDWQGMKWGFVIDKDNKVLLVLW